jgi:hypothetical protein
VPTLNVTPPGRRASAAITERSALAGSYYLGNRHQVIHRHTELVHLNADQSARWRLKVDFELPTEKKAQYGSHNGEGLYLFPLVFLRKSEGRTGFEAVDESGNRMPLPNRGTNDRTSALAAVKLAMELLKDATDDEGGSVPRLPQPSLEHLFECICVWRAYDSSVVLNHLIKNLDPDIVDAWSAAGLIEELEMFVDHSLVWVPLRGLPGERRTIEIANDIELSRRPLLRWHFGELPKPRFPRLRPLRAAQRRDDKQVLATGKARYGRLARRISLSVLGERIAQPLAWMPIEFDFPTIYTRRCRSYHFELKCPRGLSPRGVRVRVDSEGSAEKVPGRETLGDRAAHVYLPEIGGRGDVILRATVGIGTGAFPFLWLMMGAITTTMLWSLVAFNPNWLVAGDSKNHNEIAAAVLLIVPALLGAVVVGSDDGAVSKLISGARILVLITGLCCAAATAVLVKVEPFSGHPQAAWAVCATIATAATIPMATSWLLSMPVVWRGLGVLNSYGRQYLALGIQVALAFLLAVLLSSSGGDTAQRAVLAIGMLVLAVPLILLATNRLAIGMGASRRFVSIGAMLAAVACLVLGCVELQRIFAPHATWQIDVEDVEKWIFLLAPSTGFLLWAMTRLIGPGKEELSVAPDVGRALIAGERIRELRRLREMDTSDDPDRRWDLPGGARAMFNRARKGVA